MDRRAFVAASTGGLAAVRLSGASALAPYDQSILSRTRQATQNGSQLARPAQGLIRVLCAISRSTTQIDYIGPRAVFETWHRDPSTNRPSKQFEIFTVGESRSVVDGVIPDFTFDDAPQPHVIVVPAQTGSDGLSRWLQKTYAGADVTMSVCVGARHLAIAGLLDGKRATTHHESIDAFEKEFPKTTWVRGTRFVENDKISTAAGLTSGIDLALHVVERYYDRPTAAAVAEHLEHEGKRWMTR